MSTMPNERLQIARKRAGYASARAAARAFGWEYPTYAGHENGSRNMAVDVAQRYARAFRVPPQWLLFGQGEPSKDTSPARPLYLRGYVQAGHWAPNHDWEFDGDTWQEIQFPRPPHLAGLPLFALEVRGESMNRMYRPGTILICAAIHDLPSDPVNGDAVIVRRWADSGDVELTCKLLRVTDNGAVWLWPHSDHPEHQLPIQIRPPQTPARDALKDRGFDFQGLAQPEEPASTLASPGQIEITARVVAHIGLD